MELTYSLGAVDFRLARVEHFVNERFEGQPFMLMADGTEIRRVEMSSGRYLVIDHRPDSALPARVEFWEALNTPETQLRGLLAICDAIEPV